MPYDERTIRTLAASIPTAGWQHPILVRPHPVLARDYEIVVGELPYQAARFAGLEHLTVVVCSLSDIRALECVLLEDVRRPDLTRFELAVAYGQLIRTFKYNLAVLAKLVGKSERQVARILLLLDSPKAAREASERPSLNTEMAALERHLSGALGLEVEMMSKGRQGSVQISYANIEQLEWLVRHLLSIGIHSGPEPTRPGLAA